MESEKINPDRSGLVSENLDFATRLARRFHRNRVQFGIDLEDYIGAAMLGLCDAACRFDPSRGLNFRTYSYFRIRGAMYDLIRAAGGVSRAHFTELLSNNNSENSKSAARHELQYRFAQSLEELSQLRTLLEDFGICIYINNKSKTVDIAYASHPSPESKVVMRKMKDHLRSLIHSLPERQRQVIEYRYYHQMTFDEISRKFGGRSKSWISRVHGHAIDNLKNLIVRRLPVECHSQNYLI